MVCVMIVIVMILRLWIVLDCVSLIYWVMLNVNSMRVVVDGSVKFV